MTENITPPHRDAHEARQLAEQLVERWGLADVARGNAEAAVSAYLEDHAQENVAGGHVRERHMREAYRQLLAEDLAGPMVEALTDALEVVFREKTLEQFVARGGVL